MNSVDLITLGVFIGALLCAVCLVVALSGGVGRQHRKRIDTLRRRWSAAGHAGAATESLLHDTDEGRLGSMALRFMPRRHMLRHRLSKAGLSMTPGQYSMICLTAVMVTCLAVKFLVGAGWLIAILVGIAVGIGVPHWIVSRLTLRRIIQFTRLFPEAIDLMVRGIKSGLPISETIAAIGEEMDDPVGVEFQHITNSVKLGLTLEEALWDAARRLDSPTFKFFIISLSVQRETGGNLAETLENLGDILRKRQQLQLKIKAMSSEARASAYIIGSLPFIMFGILMLMSRSYVMPLLTDSRGIFMLGVGFVMIALGALVMSKMVKFEI